MTAVEIKNLAACKKKQKTTKPNNIGNIHW